MAYCGNCGSPLSEGQHFCPACGHPLGGSPPPAGPAGPPPAPPSQYAPPPYAAPPTYQQPGWTSYPQGSQFVPPPRKSHKGVWISLASVLVVVVVACVLVFVVFRGDIFGGGAGKSPEQTVRSLISAYEHKDVDALFSLIDPQAKDSVLAGQSEDAAKQALKEAAFGAESVAFSGIKMSTNQTSATTATVTLIAGKATVTDENGEKTTSDVSEADQPPTLELVKRDGSWYIDPKSMSLLNGGGASGGTTSTTETSGTGTTTGLPETTTTESEDTTTSAAPTTTTTVADAGGANTPEEVVLGIFQAMEHKDIKSLILLLDPPLLKDVMNGEDLDTFMQTAETQLFDFQSVKFSDIEVKTTYTSDDEATVEVTAGTVTMVDSSGTPQTEDVTESSEPVTLDIFEENGRWYADPSNMF